VVFDRRKKLQLGHMIYRIVIVPFICILGFFGFKCGLGFWFMASLGAIFCGLVLAADMFLARRKRRKLDSGHGETV
jgi:Na+-driven multidrug efflux pump